MTFIKLFKAVLDVLGNSERTRRCVNRRERLAAAKSAVANAITVDSTARRRSIAPDKPRTIVLGQLTPRLEHLGIPAACFGRPDILDAKPDGIGVEVIASRGGARMVGGV